MLTHTIDASARLVVVSGNGESPLDGASDSFRRLREQRVALHGFGVLILVDEAAPVPELRDLHLLGEMVQMLAADLGGPVAIVARGPDQATPAALLELGAEAVDGVRAFYDEAEARRWLGGFARS